MNPSIEQEIRDLHELFGSSRDPEGRAFVPLADAYRRAGLPERALRILSDGAERHRNLPSAMLVEGLVHRDLDDADQAEAAFRRVLESDPDNARALVELGRLLALRPDDSAAEESDALVRRGLDLDPTLAPPSASPGADVSPDDTGLVAVDELAPAWPEAKDDEPGPEPVDESPASSALAAQSTDSTDAADDDGVDSGAGALAIDWDLDVDSGWSEPSEPVFGAVTDVPDSADLDLDIGAPDFGIPSVDSGIAESDVADSDVAEWDPVDSASLDPYDAEPEEPEPYDEEPEAHDAEARDAEAHDAEARDAEPHDAAAASTDSVEAELDPWSGPEFEPESLERLPTGEVPPEALIRDLTEVVRDLEPEGASDLDDADDDEAVLPTRTLGELYARQGLIDDAIAVFEALAASDPADFEAAARLIELRAGTLPDATTATESVARAEASSHDAAQGDAPGEEGTSIRESLRALLTWSPGTREVGAVPGETAHDGSRT